MCLGQAPAAHLNVQQMVTINIMTSAITIPLIRILRIFPEASIRVLTLPFICGTLQPIELG